MTEKLIGCEYPHEYFYSCIFWHKDYEWLDRKRTPPLDPNVWYVIKQTVIYAERTIFRWFPPAIGAVFIYDKVNCHKESDSSPNLMTKTQVDPDSGLTLTFATDNPKYASIYPAVVSMDNDPKIERTAIHLGKFSNSGYDAQGNPIVCIDTAILPTTLKRKYTKRKLNRKKRKKD